MSEPTEAAKPTNDKTPAAQESTPIGDAVAQEFDVPDGAEVDDADEPSAENAVNPNHLEDDDPTSLAGDFVDEDGDGVDDRKEQS